MSFVYCRQRARSPMPQRGFTLRIFKYKIVFMVYFIYCSISPLQICRLQFYEWQRSLGVRFSRSLGHWLITLCCCCCSVSQKQATRTKQNKAIGNKNVRRKKKTLHKCIELRAKTFRVEHKGHHVVVWWRVTRTRTKSFICNLDAAHRHRVWFRG